MSWFTTADGIRLHFSDSGSGQPLLCLAGLTRNGLDFSFLAPHLSGVRLITLDSRGRGASDNDPDYGNYNVLREARDVIALLDHLGLARVTLLGTSRGGLVAMMLAAHHRDRLAGVILNDIGPEIGARGIARIMEYVGHRPLAKTLDAAAADMQAAMAGDFPDVPREVWRRQAEYQYRQTETGLALRYDPNLRKALLEQAAAGDAPDMWAAFEALRDLPLGVLRGTNSDILTRETLDEMHRRHPGMISCEVPNRGHVPFLDEPGSLTLIRNLLKDTA